jgi:hypothetical protein
MGVQKYQILIFAVLVWCTQAVAACISHWERLKATQAFCRYRKMYGLVVITHQWMRVYMKLSITVSILVCKSLNGKTCQYSNNTFQKSFSFAKLNSQMCKGPHRPDVIRQRDTNFQFSDKIAKIAKWSRIFEKQWKILKLNVIENWKFVLHSQRHGQIAVPF